MSGSGGGRGVFALAGTLLAWSPAAFALNPALDISQYAHTVWKIRDGFPKGMVDAIAQTPDGYLWLGTEFGLFRFDGVASAPWKPPRDQRLPDNYIRSLLVARDGTLWIGTFKGLASWKDGKLTQYAELAGLDVSALLEDRKGTVWVGSSVAAQKVCSIRKRSVQCSTLDGGPDSGIRDLYEDREGNLWAKTGNGLWKWTPGPPKFLPVSSHLRLNEGLAETDEGSLLISTSNGLRRLADGSVEAYPLPGKGTNFQARRLLRDRDGGLWIGTVGQGLVHVHLGTADTFRQSEGLSADIVIALFEDREGNIWVSTNNGLDRFRDFAIPTYSGNQGLSSATVAAVLAARDGSIWVSTFDGLKHWSHGQVTSYRERAHLRPATPGKEVTGSGLLEQGISSIFEDDRGRIWVATVDGIGYLENDHFTSVRSLPGGLVLSIAEDVRGNLWIANLKAGLFQLSHHGDIQKIPWARFGPDESALSVIPDPRQGGIWLGFYRGELAYSENGQVRASYTAADGLGEGWVRSLRLDPDGTLWAATQGGLSRVKDGRVGTLTSKNGLPCDTVHWMIEDDSDSSWLYMACGLVRVARSELDAWAAGRSDTVRVTVFDSYDGVRLLALAPTYGPQVSKSRDGKLWFASIDGISMVDPDHLPFNSIPPPVHIEDLTADRKPCDSIEGQHLPPLIRDLQIDYTALSLAAPEKVKFRYKLEGHDPDWVDAGTRRQAFYNDLKPRKYRFHVKACNNSGVWNEAGAFLDFSVDPAYYQTAWFKASCVAAVLVLLAAAYQLRLRYLKHQFDLRLEERVGERTRIARELHDTLLQSFQGTLLKFAALSYRVERPEVREQLESTIEQGRRAITEGRDAVQGLRSSTVVTNNLVSSIAAHGEQLAAEHAGADCPQFRVRAEGESRDLAPLVRDEVHRIACEAIRNAFRHADAKAIEVEIQYGGRQFWMCVRDNGKGIDSTVLAEGQRAGHHGLPGMKERAGLAGGKLTVLRRPDCGTEVNLTIPASFAYVKS